MNAIAMSLPTKTWMTLALVCLAVFEFVTAMYVFGRRGEKKHTRLMLRLHRVGGYVFLLWWLWPMFVGLDLLERLSRRNPELPEGLKWTFDGPRFYPAFLAVAVLLLLLLKMGFARLWPNYRRQARTPGIAVTLLAITTWVIAGLFWVAMMGSAVIER